VIFQYVPKTQALTIKGHLGPEAGDDPASTIRLGVEVNSPFRVSTAFVLYDGKIVSYDINSFARTDVLVHPLQFIGAWAQN